MTRDLQELNQDQSSEAGYVASSWAKLPQVIIDAIILKVTEIHQDEMINAVYEDDDTSTLTFTLHSLSRVNRHLFESCSSHIWAVSLCLDMMTELAS